MDQLQRSIFKVTTKPKYGNDEQVHHIVAQKHRSAAESRRLLFSVNLDTEIEENKVSLSRFMHQRLHNGFYFKWIELEMKSAVPFGTWYTENRLNQIKATLKGWDGTFKFILSSLS